MNSGTEVSTKLSTVFQAIDPSAASEAGPPQRTSTTTPAMPRPNAIQSPESSRTVSRPVTSRRTISQLIARAPSQLGDARRRLAVGQLAGEHHHEPGQHVEDEEQAADGHAHLGNPERRARDLNGGRAEPPGVEGQPPEV